jgi:hypothetical protein
MFSKSRVVLERIRGLGVVYVVVGVRVGKWGEWS